MEEAAAVVDSMVEATLAVAMGAEVTPVLMVMEDITITADMCGLAMYGPTIDMVTLTLITRTCAMTLITDTTGLRTLAIEATNFEVIAGLFDQPYLWVSLPQRTPRFYVYRDETRCAKDGSICLKKIIP